MVLRHPLEDPALADYYPFLRRRAARIETEANRIRKAHGSLSAYADMHLRMGLQHCAGGGWRMLEYMPAAERLWLTTDRIAFTIRADHAFSRRADGLWELCLPEEALSHGTYYELRVWTAETGIARRVPAFARWVEQDSQTPSQWCARVWFPEQAYRFRWDDVPRERQFPRLYEAHVGMAQPSRLHKPGSVGTYAAFASDILPRVCADGYTGVQLMGIPEHPLYKSFGYQVGSYFAPSSRYGTPDDFCALIDEAHRLGLSVILDITHSHASPNTEQGIARYDTSEYLFSRNETQWGTPSFDYEKEVTRRFLLSNCRYWLEVFHVDGFRFDAVGNTLYCDHGIDDDFSHVGRCFYGKNGEPRANAGGETYLGLANIMVHEICPDAVTIAEEFSGMPGLTCPPEKGGLGFDYRFAMGIPDFWAKYIRDGSSMGTLWYEMTNHRPYDRTISYVACHDQCINGEDAMIWRIIGDGMYTHMSPFNASWSTTRGTALYRLMRGMTMLSADAGFLNFMGDEFGHPEWLDDGEHAHRQWHLADDEVSFYAGLARWDRALLREIVGECLPAFRQPPLFRYIHEERRLIAFERGNLLCVFNFHETLSQSSLTFRVTPGKYVEALSSDETRFGGCGNLDSGPKAVEHFSDAGSGIDLQNVTVYLPALTALILRRE